MREIVRTQQAYLDKEYKGKDIPEFKVLINEDKDEK